MTTLPRLRVDFQNADVVGRIRLNTVGTAADVAEQAVTLVDGLSVDLVDAELSSTGVVRWSGDERIWVAELSGPITSDE